MVVAVSRGRYKLYATFYFSELVFVAVNLFKDFKLISVMIVVLNITKIIFKNELIRNSKQDKIFIDKIFENNEIILSINNLHNK